MSKISEILRKYSNGKSTMVDANAELKAAGATFKLDATKSTITPIEHALGYGWLDTGTGTKDKVRMMNGELVGCDVGESKALFIYGDKVYDVQGKKLFLKD